MNKIYFQLLTVLSLFLLPLTLFGEKSVSPFAKGDKFHLEFVTATSAPFISAPYVSSWKIVSKLDGKPAFPGEARLVGAIYADHADGRAHFYPTRILVVHPDKKKKFYNLKGVVLGIDGEEGVRGKLEPITGHPLCKSIDPKADSFGIEKLDSLKRGPYISNFQSYCSVAVEKKARAVLQILDAG